MSLEATSCHSSNRAEAMARRCALLGALVGSTPLRLVAAKPYKPELFRLEELAEGTVERVPRPNRPLRRRSRRKPPPEEGRAGLQPLVESCEESLCSAVASNRKGLEDFALGAPPGEHELSVLACHLEELLDGSFPPVLSCGTDRPPTIAKTASTLAGLEAHSYSSGSPGGQ